MDALVEANWLELMPLTVPSVPTGINFGVSTIPCGVWNIPVLAAEFLQKDVISKSNTIFINL